MVFAADKAGKKDLEGRMKLSGKALDREELYFTYPQEENPDWDYARNRFFLLKRTQGCWSSSFFTVKFRDFLMPNRDYPQQGLVCKIGDEYMKFLDAIGFKLENEQEVLNLTPTKVKVSPWKAIYFYRSGDTTLKVAYYLAKTQEKNKLGGWTEFSLDSEREKEFKLVLSPLVDIRNAGGESLGNHSFEQDGEVVRIGKGENEIVLGLVEQVNQKEERINWKYKLGNGERELKDGQVLFKGVEKSPTLLGEMKYRLKSNESVKVGVVCGKGVGRMDLELALSKDEEEDLEKSEEMLKKFSLESEELAERFYMPRLLTFNKFGLWENNLQIPEAGEWWFKEVWFRDLFESIYHNLEFYRKVKGDQWLKKIFSWTKLYIKDGVMANKVAKRKVEYNSLDAAFLYLLAMAKFYEKTGDENFREEVRKTYPSVLSNFDEKALIKCKANYSWLDSKWEGRPGRIPDGWEVEATDNFLLPEVNALWIKVLEKFNSICDGNADVEDLWSRWKNTFWNQESNYPYQLVYQEGGQELKDPTESSVGIVCVALLLDHFSGNQVLDIWKTAKEKLLVKRTPVFFEKVELPFGLLVKNSDKRIFLNDEQYHEAVVWPRDLPYLFKVLEKLGKEEIVDQLSINLLDHQMSEGAIGYNHELFSLPEGENPSKMALPENPVPVKNPVQLWSHFVKPIKIGSK